MGELAQAIDPTDAEALLPYEDASRNYYAMRGRRVGGGRVLSVLFVPNEGTHDRAMERADLRMTDTAKNGREIILEFSAWIIVITGRNLHPVAAAMGVGWPAALEAFDPELRDMPAADAPFIERIDFHRQDKQQEPERDKAEKPHLVKS